MLILLRVPHCWYHSQPNVCANMPLMQRENLQDVIAGVQRQITPTSPLPLVYTVSLSGHAPGHWLTEGTSVVPMEVTNYLGLVMVGEDCRNQRDGRRRVRLSVCRLVYQGRRGWMNRGWINCEH